MTAATVFFAILVFGTVIAVIGYVAIRFSAKAEGRPSRELQYAVILLERVLWQDDVVPILPEQLRDEIKLFTKRQQRELTR